jgi:hypothetical protein
MDIVEWLLENVTQIIGVGVGIFCLLLLLSIEHDLKILLIELADSNKGINKLVNSLMGSLNDLRKLIHQTKRHDKDRDR